ncbi:MAG: hypothetical protein A2Y73_08655 [Chloroflexi bacterium RBG_13_56_8]|nr:MAG: hypothetical protein A2Y73_08655 [Chloroflexi bacterium RBG_13_56_8]
MANLITVLRFPLLILVVILLNTSSSLLRLITVFLVILLIAMDSLDGIIARWRKETSLMGSVLDIMADRAVELLLWISFAHLRLIPVAIPIIYVLRGTVVDSLRSLHVSAGTAPFKAMRTNWGKFLVTTPLMRTGYALSKLISFTGLALTHALAAYVSQGIVRPEIVLLGHPFDKVQLSSLVFNLTSWISVALCLARGLPVVIEALPILQGREEQG